MGSSCARANASTSPRLENVPGGFSVWAASPEASFLHGRFVWVTWDVEDLASGEVRAQIDADPWLLKVGVKGL